MKQRHQQLLHLLARQEWIKGRELASCLGVSARTVRSDIEQINREMPHIIQADRQKRISPRGFPTKSICRPRRIAKSATR